MTRLWGLVLLACCLVCPQTAMAKTLTYEDLCRRLIDLEHISLLPEPGESCRQWSSYDRSSSYNPKTDSYVNWDANGDHISFIRTEGDQQVLAEMDGPGCIWRIWSALPQEGHVKIYLDGSQDPVVDLPFIGYFNGKNEPFTYSSLVYKSAQGQNCYVPIPYQRSCKIVADKGWGGYYHFTYTRFSHDTRLPTFSRNLSFEDKEALSEVDRFLRIKLGTQPATPGRDKESVAKQIELAPGKSVVLADVRGERAISSIWMQQKDDTDLRKALRSTTISIYWDNSEKPAVWAPIGDFFGTAPGLQEYKGLPLGATKDGLYCYFYMPFATRGKVVLTNDGGSPFNASFVIDHVALERPASDYGRFHAKWHRDAFLPEDEGRSIDWPMLVAKGRGRYVGVALEVWNPAGGWWGEGDEKFFVDGEKFPSTFGTGSEDYFGYAWGDSSEFSMPFHAQPINEDNMGHILNTRFHIADNVPFFHSFEGSIEKYFGPERKTNYAATAYFYLSPDGEDPYGPLSLDKRTNWYEEYPIYVLENGIEAENLKVVFSEGDARMQPMAPDWSAGKHLLWLAPSKNRRLELEIVASEAGKYDLSARFTQASDYAIVSVEVNDETVAGNIDLYGAPVAPIEIMKLGTVELLEGENTLSIVTTGKNEKSTGYYVGLDAIKLDEK